MSLLRYCKDRLIPLSLLLLLAVGTGIFLSATGTQRDIIWLLAVFYLLITAFCILVGWRRCKRRFDALWRLFDALEQKELFSEVTPPPRSAEEEEFYLLLRRCNKAMLEHVDAVTRERQDYQEYIEQWVHEIKTPLAAMKLLCENRDMPERRKLLAALERTERLAEQALYYARAGAVDRDYLVREIPLDACMRAAVLRNKQLLLQNGGSVTVGEAGLTAYCDEKWVGFLLDQLIGNAVKYRRGDSCRLKLSARPVQNGVSLTVEDNGLGIPGDELPRIFDKGFTGTNGRMCGGATGLGLYLCRRLCGQLGIKITAASEPGRYTRVTLLFPKGTLVKPESDGREEALIIGSGNGCTSKESPSSFGASLQ